MDIFSVGSAFSLEDDDQNLKIKILTEKIDAISAFLNLGFKEIEVEEKYKNFWGNTKIRKVKKMIAI